MKNVVVKKDDLTAIVQTNREAHQAIFEEAVEGYRVENERILREHLEDVIKGRVFKIYVSLPMPENHIGDYDRVLKMLEMSVDDEIMIDQDSFAAYVMDDWDWKQQFLRSNSSYSMTAAKLSQ